MAGHCPGLPCSAEPAQALWHSTVQLYAQYWHLFRWTVNFFYKSPESRVSCYIVCEGSHMTMNLSMRVYMMMLMVSDLT